ncbi:MAG: hypothetical protein JNN17_02200 [Verrucomicrobiaceae bacterium]|nr:hypothetical protein [Verrucomicrobiaceae bacterium]
MIRLRPQILHQNGKPQFAVIPYADFLAIEEELEDAACVRILRKAKAIEGRSTTLPLNAVKARLGLGTSRIRWTSRPVA